MKTWHLVVNVAKCEDCNNCFMACKDEHVDNEWPGYALPQPRHGHRWVNILRKERGRYPLIDVAYLPKFCQHCDDAPCVRASKGAVTKRADGIVLIDPVRARGDRTLVDSCPYGMIWWNEERDVAQKCTFCAHLIDDGWKQPRCVQACPTGALRAVYGEEAEMDRLVREEGLEVLRPELPTRPRVYYKDLYRYTKCFIAGSVAVREDGVEDCAQGAKVALFKDGEKMDEVLTDNFGDFKFDGLGENSGTYVLNIEYKGHEHHELEVCLQAHSINVGIIAFDALTKNGA